ncbi:MAG: hypothetical protein D9C04_01565 [Nitrosopumilus sp. B06]|nr:MAG: hypothetical protein D9C04_01565 [Nitrosopumilus sp. B06]
MIMASDVSDLIKALKESDLAAECPHCGDTFQLSDSLLFDGRGNFPAEAEIKRLELLEDLKEATAKFTKQQEYSTRSEKLTISAGVGTTVEKTLPAHGNLELKMSDSRFLGEPIDLILFDGLSKNRVDKITFIEIKTGAGRLNDHQKQTRDAINDHKVEWRYF